MKSKRSPVRLDAESRCQIISLAALCRLSPSQLLKIIIADAWCRLLPATMDIGETAKLLPSIFPTMQDLLTVADDDNSKETNLHEQQTKTI